MVTTLATLATVSAVVMVRAVAAWGEAPNSQLLGSATCFEHCELTL